MNRPFTKRPPAVDGFYWARRENGNLIMAHIHERVVYDESGHRAASQGWWVLLFPERVERALDQLVTYEWAGPLGPDEI